MLRNKVVWVKHYYFNRFTVRNIFLLRYSRFRLMCTFKSYIYKAIIIAVFRLISVCLVLTLFYFPGKFFRLLVNSNFIFHLSHTRISKYTDGLNNRYIGYMSNYNYSNEEYMVAYTDVIHLQNTDSRRKNNGIGTHRQSCGVSSQRKHVNRK